MRNHRNRAARPDLERMETRIVPTAIGMQVHASHAVTAQINHLSNIVTRSTANHDVANSSTQSLKQRQQLIRTLIHHYAPPAHHNNTVTPVTGLNSLFKSLFGNA